MSHPDGGDVRTAGQGVGGGSATGTLLGGGGLCAILHAGRTALILQLLYPSLHQNNSNVGIQQLKHLTFDKTFVLDFKTTLDKLIYTYKKYSLNST